MKSAVNIKTTYECCAPGCGETLVLETAAAIGGQMCTVIAPPNWRIYYGVLFCPKHQVSLIVDSETKVEL